MRETSKTIEDKALQWVARLDRTGLNASEDPQLTAWLAADTRNKGAFMRAMAAWHHLERATAMNAEEPTTVQTSKTDKSRRWLFGAAACAAAVAGGFALNHYNEMAARITTARGEIRRVPLQDGSLLAINTSTTLKVDIEKDLRRVRIDEGEAWVQVASNAARPFVVSAGDIRVRAIGTAFSVRKTAVGAEVLVTEGVVEVWSVHTPTNVRRLTAGHGTLISASTGEASARSSLDEVHRKLAWREGEIVLAGERLHEAVAEFNRYNDVQIIIDDPDIADSEWFGRFRTNEPQAFARSVAVTTRARVEIGPRLIHIGKSMG